MAEYKEEPIEVKEIDIEYLYILLDGDRYILKGSKSSRALEKIIRKNTLYGIYPTVNSESDRNVLKLHYKYNHCGYENLDRLKTLLDKFYNTRYDKYRMILKKKLTLRINSENN